MKKTSKKFVIIGSVVVIVALGVLVSMFGNVGVRRNILGEETLSVTSPLVPGVPFAVGWEAKDGVADKSVLLKLRTTAGEAELEAARYADKSLTTKLSCSVPTGEGSLILVELLTNKVIAQEAVSILPPGQDCVP